MCIRALSWQCATSSQLPVQCTVFNIWKQSLEAADGGFAVDLKCGVLKGNAKGTDSGVSVRALRTCVWWRWRNNTTDSVLDEDMWSPSTPVALPYGKSSDTYCIGRWVTLALFWTFRWKQYLLSLLGIWTEWSLSYNVVIGSISTDLPWLQMAYLLTYLLT